LAIGSPSARNASLSRVPQAIPSQIFIYYSDTVLGIFNKERVDMTGLERGTLMNIVFSAITSGLQNDPHSSPFPFHFPDSFLFSF
jgi:hypothetical protein